MGLKKQTYILLLGTNLGIREANINKALQYIELRIGKIKKVSNLYETAAWGNTNQQSFLNMAVKIESIFTPLQVLQKALQIELLMGRKRLIKWGERTIDIDMLYCGARRIQTKELIVPHPQISARRFTLVCLNDIDPNWVDPKTLKTVKTMLLSCEDMLAVKKL